MKKYLLTIALFGILLGGAILIYNRLNSGPEYKADLAYSSFIKQVKAGRIERVEITGKVIRFGLLPVRISKHITQGIRI